MWMKRVYLILAAVLFLAWAGWLAYEAVTNSDPLVVSRPQLLLAPIVVEANVPPPGGADSLDVSIVHAYRGNALLGLPEGRAIPDGFRVKLRGLPEAQGWNGPGSYILAILRRADGADAAYELVPTPASPGFANRARQRIYPASDDVRQQVHSILSR